MRRVLPGDKPLVAEGYHFDLPMDAYHEDPAISKSGLSDMARSPLHYVAGRQDPEKEKAHLSLGTLAHALILQPDDIDDIVAIPPVDVLAKNGARSGNKYKQWEKAQDPGITIVTQDLWDKGRRMADSVLEDPEHVEARLLLTSGMSEVAFFYADPTRKIRIKVRPDHLPGGGIVADLKTCRDGSVMGFGKDSFNLKYHWSGYLTCQVVTEVTEKHYGDYRFVCVENELPFDVSIYKMGEDHMMAAREEVEHYLNLYADCYHTNTWPGYSPRTEPLTWPAWAWKKVHIYDEYNIYE